MNMPLTPEKQAELDKAQLALDTGQVLTPEQKNILTQLGSTETILKVSDRGVTETETGKENYTEYQTNKYSVEQTSYPKDLMTNPIYGKNYVVYYINEYDGVSTSSAKHDTVSDANMGIYTESGSSNTGVGGTVGTTAAATTAVGSVLKNGISVKSVLGAGVKGGAVGALAGTIANYAGIDVAGTTRKRLKMAIALPVPNDLSFSDSWTWTTSESALSGAGIDAASSQLSNLVAGDGSFMDRLKSAKSVAGTAVGGIMTKLSSALPTQKALIRQTVNEKQEVLFNGVDHRTFTHTFQFAATSKEEVENIDKIIKAFRYHAANDYVDQLSFIMVYPSDFDIMYYHNKNENRYIPKHTSCVLTSISTNFSPNSLFATFGGGAPIMITLTLQFKELAVISKNEIKRGY